MSSRIRSRLLAALWLAIVGYSVLGMYEMPVRTMSGQCCDFDDDCQEPLVCVVPEIIDAYPCDPNENGTGRNYCILPNM